MASSSVLKIASVTSTKPFGKTDAEVANVVRWFMKDKEKPPEGLTQAQLNQWYLDRTNDEIVNYIKAHARRNRIDELASQQQSIEDQATSETDI